MMTEQNPVPFAKYYEFDLADRNKSPSSYAALP